MIRIIDKTELKQESKSVLGVGVVNQTPKYKCMVYDEKTPDDKYETILSKEAVELIEMMNRMAKQLKIYPAMMDEVWNKICNFSDSKYQLGLKDCNEKWRNS